MDVEGAKDAFESLSLCKYPEENIKALATEALRLLKILNGDYDMPRDTGSKLLKKVTSTESQYFNRRIYAHLDIFWFDPSRI